MKVLFVDMDNTIAENKTCEDIEYYPGLYLEKRPIGYVIEAINIMREQFEDLIIVSKVQGESKGIREKIQWLDENNVKFNGFIFIVDNSTKADKILSYCKIYNINPAECLLIDDKKEVLQECLRKGIQVAYPQQILAEYYNHEQKVKKK